MALAFFPFNIITIIQFLYLLYVKGGMQLPCQDLYPCGTCTYPMFKGGMQWYIRSCQLDNLVLTLCLRVECNTLTIAA